MTRTCTTCKTEKAADQFSKRLGGLAYKCKACASAYGKARWLGLSADDKAKEIAAAAAAKRNNPAYKEVQRVWRQAAAEKRSAYAHVYYEQNREKWTPAPGVYARRAAARKASRLAATPMWTDAELVADIYKYAAIMRQAGVDCHVDHIVPLRSNRVCGLHAHTNLTVILAYENRAKGNRHWPDA